MIIIYVEQFEVHLLVLMGDQYCHNLHRCIVTDGRRILERNSILVILNGVE